MTRELIALKQVNALKRNFFVALWRPLQERIEEGKSASSLQKLLLLPSRIQKSNWTRVHHENQKKLLLSSVLFGPSVPCVIGIKGEVKKVFWARIEKEDSWNRIERGEFLIRNDRKWWGCPKRPDGLYPPSHSHSLHWNSLSTLTYGLILLSKSSFKLLLYLSLHKQHESMYWRQIREGGGGTLQASSRKKVMVNWVIRSSLWLSLVSKHSFQNLLVSLSLSSWNFGPQRKMFGGKRNWTRTSYGLYFWVQSLNNTVNQWNQQCSRFTFLLRGREKGWRKMEMEKEDPEQDVKSVIHSSEHFRVLNWCNPRKRLRRALSDPFAPIPTKLVWHGKLMYHVLGQDVHVEKRREDDDVLSRRTT